MSAIPLSTLATARRWQQNFLVVLPTVQEHAAVSFRHLRTEAKAEATAEAVASACVSYAKLARQKKLARVYPSIIATFAVKAVNGFRHVGGHQSCRDVMSPLTQKRRGFTVGSLSGVVSSGGPLARGCRGFTTRQPRRPRRVPTGLCPVACTLAAASPPDHQRPGCGSSHKGRGTEVWRVRGTGFPIAP